MADVCLIRPCEGVSLTSASGAAPGLPLGLAYIASSLRAAGHAVRVVDAVGLAITNVFEKLGVHWLGLDNAAVVDRIPPGVAIVGIGNMFSHNWPAVRELVCLIKQRRPEVTIVLGGEHISSMPELVFEQSPADYCVVAEGEETAVELFAALEKGAPTNEIAGIAYRAPDGRVVKTPRRNRIRDIDQIPPPAWDLFAVETYAENNLANGMQIGEARPVIPILATRGCPYQCTFCTSPDMWTTTWIARDPELVLDEIASYVERYGARNFPFQDLTAIVRRDWVVRFCRGILDRGLDISWQFPTGTRVEVIDDEVAALMKAAGIVHIAYAPESGSDELRRIVKKKIQRDKFLESVRAGVRQGLHVQCFFVFGFPEETLRDVLATLRFVAILAWMGVRDIAASYFIPYPGSAMYRKLLAEGKLDTTDRWLLGALHHRSLFMQNQFMVNDRYPHWVQNAAMLASFVIFYSISLIRQPVFFAKMLVGIVARPEHDVSRLQKGLKTFLHIRSRYRGATR